MGVVILCQVAAGTFGGKELGPQMHHPPSSPAASCLSATLPCENQQPHKTDTQHGELASALDFGMILTSQVRPKLPGYPDPARCKPAQPTISSAVAHMVHRPSVKLRRLSSKVYRIHEYSIEATANIIIARECKQDRIHPAEAPL